MNTLNLNTKALYASKHFSKILFWEFAYCIAVFFCFRAIPLINQNNIVEKQTLAFIYLGLLLLVPLLINLVQIYRNSRRRDYLKRSNYILAEILSLVFVFWFLA